MKKYSPVRILLLSLVTISCLFAPLSGVMEREAAALQHDFSIGRGKGPVEVYLFSDWFCPVCRKVEPVVESAVPGLIQKAKITFVDKPIYPESANFVPYHLSFAAYEKEKYLQLRKALFDLAKRTKNPTVADISAAIAPLKVTYRQLSFMEVTQQTGRFQALAGRFKVAATPTMVFFNARNNKTRTLVGGNEITADGIAKALKSVE